MTLLHDMKLGQGWSGMKIQGPHICHSRGGVLDYPPQNSSQFQVLSGHVEGGWGIVPHTVQ